VLIPSGEVVERLIRAELLALYDHDERFAATFPDTRREELPGLVRQLDLVERAGQVVYTDLDESTIEAAIQEQVAYFGSLDREFEWKAYAHDRPADLVARLAQHGFLIDEPEAILVLDLHSVSMASTSTVHVRRVADAAELAAIASIKRLVDGPGAGDHLQRLQLELEHDPDYLSMYLAYADEHPVACGWVRFPSRSAFASLWGGSTVPEFRGKGLYTALLAARVDEARSRNYRYLTVDARNMSRPILERRGFQRLTTATACVWSPTRLQPT
jgi:GNAT superfamily N-acetyltransferase